MSTLNLMQIVILAAGQSSRFEPFNETFPHKSLVKVLGKTIIEHMLDAVKKIGINNVVIVVNSKEPFVKIFGDGSGLGICIRYVILNKPLGMGAALLQAKNYLQESFFLTNTNHIEIDQFVAQMGKMQKDTPNDVVLLGKEQQGFSTYGFMKIKNDRVTEIIEKPIENVSESLRIVGIYLLNNAFVKELEKLPPGHYNFETALDMYAKQNKVRYLQTDDDTLSLKYGWDLLTIKDYLLKSVSCHISKSAKISKTAQISGSVYIDEDATIMDNAVIKGPAYIGKNSIIGTSAIVRNSTSIEENVVVGAFMEVKNCLIMNGTTTHTGILEDSVLGRNCKIAAGVVTANVRLDRKNIFAKVKGEKVDSGRTYFGMLMGDAVQFGIRVSVMPGMIIGKNVIVGPSTVVIKNIASESKYYTQFKEIVELPDQK